MATAKPKLIAVEPDQALEIKFTGRPKFAVGHMKQRGEDRAFVAMPVASNGPEAPLLILAHSKQQGAPAVQQAIYMVGDEEKAFIGTASDGAGALFLLVDGSYQRLDFDMLERHIRENTSFGETV